MPRGNAVFRGNRYHPARSKVLALPIKLAGRPPVPAAPKEEENRCSGIACFMAGRQEKMQLKLGTANLLVNDTLVRAQTVRILRQNGGATEQDKKEFNEVFHEAEEERG
jgi:hypothetical protein